MTPGLEKGRYVSQVCRASNLCICRHIGALLIATGSTLQHRWLPSKLNPADEPSRRHDPLDETGQAIRGKPDSSTIRPPWRRLPGLKSPDSARVLSHRRTKRLDLVSFSSPTPTSLSLPRRGLLPEFLYGSPAAMPVKKCAASALKHCSSSSSRATGGSKSLPRDSRRHALDGCKEFAGTTARQSCPAPSGL